MTELTSFSSQEQPYTSILRSLNPHRSSSKVCLRSAGLEVSLICGSFIETLASFFAGK
jgi:hypothetical protein